MVVLLTNGSVGEVSDTRDDMIEVGSVVRIELQDENGNLVDEAGTVAEILEA